MIAALLLLQVTAADPCNQDPRCRLERARVQELARYQAAYLRALERWVQAADEAADEMLPHRTRHPLGLDFYFGNSMPTWGITAGYTPYWPVRVELFYGRGEVNRFDSTTDPMTGYPIWTSSYAKLQTWGFQQRWYLLPSMFSPVVTTGLGFSHGDYDSSVSCYNCGGGGSSHFFGVGAHTVYSGAGVDMQWTWLHVLVAWRFGYTFYASVVDDAGQHMKDVEKDLKNAMGDHMEAVQIEIGARY